MQRRICLKLGRAWARQGGSSRGEQMCTVGSLQGLSIHSGHTYTNTHTRRAKALVQWPTACLYPPTPPKALKPCSYACMLCSVFPWNPSFLYQFILPLPGIHLSSSQILFYHSTQTFSSKPHPFSPTPLSCPPQGFLLCFFPTLLQLLSMKVHSPVTAAPECQTAIY